eukprot:m.181633 g.181633  ORF g.181633 m.181633 type:complete len:75 (-) comp14966_c0_seq9:14290-14514(-)
MSGKEEEEASEQVVSENEDPTDTDSDEEEDPADYKKGGYHPVNIGDVFKRRYKVSKNSPTKCPASEPVVSVVGD